MGKGFTFSEFSFSDSLLSVHFCADIGRTGLQLKIAFPRATRRKEQLFPLLPPIASHVSSNSVKNKDDDDTDYQ
ncbi:hypothetical protein C0Q70_05375, partial [Pomacea canaliculata]